VYGVNQSRRYHQPADQPRNRSKRNWALARGRVGAHCQADERYVWWVVTAFVLMDAEPARVAELAEEIAAIEGVAEAYSVAGNADIVAIIRVRQIEELAQVVTGRLAGLRGVTDTRTLVAFQSHSRKDLDEMWELGAEG